MPRSPGRLGIIASAKGCLATENSKLSLGGGLAHRVKDRGRPTQTRITNNVCMNHSMKGTIVFVAVMSLFLFGSLSVELQSL